MNQTEEIKSRLDIVEVIREYMPNLKQAGSNWKAPCPFHNEKTPSFMVSAEKQIWHCFGCGKGGDIFGFVMEQEGLEFLEALRLLAKKAGVVLQYQDPGLATQKTKLLDICALATKFFHYILLEKEEGKKTREYLKTRQVSDEAIENFQLGFSLDSWDALSNFLVKKGFKENDIFLAGLSVKKERGSGFYDRFRGRLIFPITDLHGSVVGFTARIMVEDKTAAKYINTPQTMIYDKSGVIYGLDKAKSSIKKQDLAVMVEGNMDVIASHQVGVENVIASSGTALTMRQVQLLKRYSKNLALCFDMDAAGQIAAQRGIDVALSEGMNVRVILLPPDAGKDPDDCIKKKGKEAWQKAIAEAMPFMDYYFAKTFSGLDLSKVENKKTAAKIILNQIIKLQDQVEQTHYLQKLSRLLNVSEDVLRDSLPKKQTVRSEATSSARSPRPEKQDRNSMITERLVSLVLRYPEHLDYVIDHLLPEMIVIPSLGQIYKNLIIHYNKIKDSLKASGEKLDLSKFSEILLEAGVDKSYLHHLTLLVDRDFPEDDFNEEEIKQEMIETIKLVKDNYYDLQRKEILAKMKSAEEAGDNAEAEKLSREYNSLPR